jgi:fructose-bisphosphate aldolase class II
MGLLQIVKAGVLQGSSLHKVFEYSKKNNFAIPCINVINGESINAVLESASISNSAVIVQISYENAKLFAGKVHKGESSTLGAINVANYVHTIASSYKIPVILTTDYVSSRELHWLDELLLIGSEYYKNNACALYTSYALDLSTESYEDSLKIAKKYLKKASRIGMGLELKIAINYSNSKVLCTIYEELEKVSKNFMISFSFIDEERTDKKKLFTQMQKIIQTKFKTKSKPLNLVFDGDFCLKKDIREIINTGVVKINLDHEIKNSFCEGIHSYAEYSNENSLLAKSIEPKKWLREIQKMIIKKVNSFIKDYNAKNSI